ncbi:MULTISPECIES: hypothetical protein [unclassified Coleofasciculus]|uniref:hypothetical protein n=1 Tax=unclassified Coleofasciculus TaxID=2692782 RepID=UPI00187EF0EA|nr:MULTISPECIES: hypothetical protein [unclassified Coleofasciculus]MBE9128938.1 hypothetical protein [Coleofasciculus sp. LEGE 07081]MBE9151684.1 hypothetical protein [Coleofasciculus sp. LEGE 07092]
MTGKVIDSSANRILIFIIPFAFLSILLYKTWPYLLGLLSVTILFKIWQQYRWLQWSKQVNPFFNQLIKENQGCLTSLDLSLKANISGSAARRYLDKKAEEFGAKRRLYEDRGIVYYFLTASALGSIFESSDPPPESEYESLTSQTPRLIQLLAEEESMISENTALTEEDEAPQKLEKSLYQDENLGEKEPEASHSLIQAELAKRLEVHSSTVGKRKSDPDFAEWSQSKDPEGIAWEYSPETREFLPLNKPS